MTTAIQSATTPVNKVSKRQQAIDNIFGKLKRFNESNHASCTPNTYDGIWLEKSDGKKIFKVIKDGISDEVEKVMVKTLIENTYSFFYHNSSLERFSKNLKRAAESYGLTEKETLDLFETMGEINKFAKDSESIFKEIEEFNKVFFKSPLGFKNFSELRDIVVNTYVYKHNNSDQDIKDSIGRFLDYAEAKRTQINDLAKTIGI